MTVYELVDPRALPMNPAGSRYAILRNYRAGGTQFLTKEGCPDAGGIHRGRQGHHRRAIRPSRLRLCLLLPSVTRDDVSGRWRNQLQRPVDFRRAAASPEPKRKPNTNL